MSRCRHRRVAVYTSPKFRFAKAVPFDPAAWTSGFAFKAVCVECGHCMPLGPASDTPEVLVEVWAAELAQATRDDRECDDAWTEEENDGWNAHVHDWPVVPGCEAGWLAREILTREEAGHE